MFDGAAFGAEIVEAVRGHVERVTAPLIAQNAELAARVAELEARAAVPGPPGEPGQDGRDGADGVKGEPGEPGQDGRDGQDGKDGADGLAGADGDQGAPGRDGEPGQDGKDAEPLSREQLVEAVLAMPDALDEVVRRHLEANPPAAGRDGVDGKDGADGQPGRDGVDGEPGEPGIDGLDGKHGRDGVDGKDGRDGLDGVHGKDGLDGRDGQDGVGVAGALKDHEGSLILTLTNGETRSLGMVDGKDGRDGVDGRDGKDGERGVPGFSLDAFDTSIKEDGRTVLLKFAQGEVEEVHELCFPVTIDRGVYKADKAYDRGDEVTWGGSLWIAQRDVALGEKPEGSDAWRLAVKRGRDGKDGKDGAAGERGPPGKDGKGF